MVGLFLFFMLFVFLNIPSDTMKGASVSDNVSHAETFYLTTGICVPDICQCLTVLRNAESRYDNLATDLEVVYVSPVEIPVGRGHVEQHFRHLETSLFQSAFCLICFFRLEIAKVRHENPIAARPSHDAVSMSVDIGIGPRRIVAAPGENDDVGV